MKLDHLSASQINIYRKCSQQYYYRYIERISIPLPSAITVGISFHNGVAHYYMQKAQGIPEPTLQEVLDIFSTSFESLKEGTEWRDEDPGIIKDCGVGATSLYHEEIAPGIMPVDVEQHFTINFDWDKINEKAKKDEDRFEYRFVGIADVISRNGLVEHKTTGRRTSMVIDDHLLQSFAYCTGLKLETGKRQPARIDYAVTTKQPEVLTFGIPFTDHEENYFMTVMHAVAKGIQKEVWIPNRGHFLCSRKYCGYYTKCIQDNGGSVKE